MMFTKKKTQAISALCAVMMLISLMTCFVLPVSAESLVYPNAGEVVSATGLYDASALPDIKNYPQTGTEYKVTDAEGMLKIAELVNRENNALSDVTIYQMADIDFTGIPFDGIGMYGRGTDVAFKGTFDGNGFVIENLFVHGISYVGLFNYANGATLKNIGVASGLVVGGEYAGVLCGYATGVKLINCWNAATIIGGSRSSAGAASFTGYTAGSTAMYNCFNVGLVMNAQFFAAGISARVDDTVELKNSFNAGSLFYCYYTGDGTFPAGYDTNAFYRNAASAGNLTPGTVNSYYSSSLIVPSCKNETGKMTPAQFADGTVASALNAVTGVNAMNALGAVSGYTVSYTNTADLDFPVITYSVGDEVKVRRVPHTTVNINNEHSDWTDKSAIWRDFLPRYKGGYMAVGTVDIGTANDLYMFTLISSVLNNPDSDNKMTNVNITADIDMNDVTLPGIPRNAEGEPIAIPMGGMSWQTSQAYGMDNVVIDGQGHSIYNWNVYSSNMGDVANSGFVGYIGNGTVQNLNLVDATVTRSNDLNDYSIYTNKRSHSVGLLVGSAYGNVKINNCSASGTVIYLNHTNEAADRSTVGGLLGDAQTVATISNSWSDCTVVMANGETFKAGAVGYARVEIAPENLSNTYYAATEAPATMNAYTANMQVHCMQYAVSNAEFAYKLTRLGLGTFTVNEEGFIVAGPADKVPARIRFVMAINGEETAELDYDFFVPGTDVTPRTYEGYTLDQSTLPSGADANGVFMMGTNDLVLQYTNDYVNLLPVRNVIAMLESFDLNLFKDADPAIAALTVADEILADYEALEAAKSTENMTTINNEVLDLVKLANSLEMELINVYPNLVPYADRDLYAQFGDIDNYLLSTLDDWLAVVDSGETFAGKTLHLANDIDMAGYPVMPLLVLEGTLDGHGYRFDNLVMAVITRGGSVGLIGNLTGTVKNVGIGSGLVYVQYDVDLDDYGVGALVGTAYSDSQVIACWNAAEVYVESLNEAAYENPVAGLVGYAYYGAVLDTCYNVGTVSGGDLVADLANGYPIVYNSFGAGDLYCTFGMTPYVVGGYEFGGAEENIVNTYGVGAEKQMSKDASYSDVNILDWDAYISAQVGWEINQNYEYTMLQERVYFTEDINGLPVFAEGTLAQQKKVQLRRVVIEKSNGETEYEFVAGGDSAVLDVLLALDMELAEESTDIASLDGNILTVNTVTDENENESVIVYAEVSPLLTDALVEEVLYFLFKDPAHFANPDGITELLNRILVTEYTNQAAIDADVIALRALKVYAYDKAQLPSVVDNFLYNDAPGYTINSYADLEYVAMYPEEFGSDKVLYLTTDLEMYGKKYDGITGLAASVDGLGHTINGYTDAHAFLIDFAGEYIKNLTFDNAFVAASENAGILVDETVAAAVIDGVSITNSVLLNGTAAPAGLLVGTADAALTVKNCEVVGSAVIHVEEVVSGLLVGAAAEVTFNNVGIFDSVANGGALLAANAANKATAVNVFTADNNVTALFTKAAAVTNAKTYAGDGYTSVDAMNAALVDADTLWNMNGETAYPALATEGKHEKHTITFERDGAEVASAYTDVNGKLYDPAIAILLGKWDVKGAITEAVFTADTTVVAMLEGSIVVRPTNVAIPGQQVNVAVSIENNPGLQGISVNVILDYANFELLAIESGNLFDPANFTLSEDALTSGAPFTAIASGFEKVTEDGVIFTMTLKVKDGLADGRYENAVVVEVTDHVDVNHNRSILHNGACEIAVSSQGFLWGDVNEDGIVLTDDAVLIMRSIVGIATPEMTNPAVGDLDGRDGLSVADAQMILHYLANPGTVLQPVNP